MYIIIFIIILAALVFVHELGHFLVAKAAGIRVDEFAIGFPPKLFSFERGGTKYSLNLIPFGGYVKIFGEDYEEAKKLQSGAENTADKARSFVGKPKSIQALVLVAGIAFNIIFAWILVSIGFMAGMPVSEEYASRGAIIDSAVTITSVQKDSPAETAGMKPGDKIAALNAGSENIENPTGDQIRSFISSREGEQISVVVERPKGTEVVSVTPTLRSGDTATIGITMESLGTLKLSFFPALWEGLKYTKNIVVMTAVGIATFIGSAFVGQANVSDVTGPVGIAGLVNDATSLGFVYLLMFTAFISVNLAIINLIPFPALDGGRILFVGIEKIIGRPLNTKIVQITNMIGLALLLLLMLVVTLNDIFKLF